MRGWTTFRRLSSKVFVQIDDRMTKDEAQNKSLQKVLLNELMIGRWYAFKIAKKILHVFKRTLNVLCASIKYLLRHRVFRNNKTKCGQWGVKEEREQISSHFHCVIARYRREEAQKGFPKDVWKGLK